MNDQRRKDISQAIKLLEQLQEAIEPVLEEVQSILEAARDEEQEYMDNMPESLQGGEKYSKAEQCVEVLEEVIGKVEELPTELDIDGMIESITESIEK